MTEEILHRRNTTLVRRLRLAPGERTPWHRDPYHRATVLLGGDALAIEYRDGSPTQRLSIRPGQVDWDEPTDRIHRGVNVGQEPYEEIAVFFLDRDGAEPQPRVNENETDSRSATDVVGVSSVVRDDDGRILLIKTAKAGWELPGGQLEAGEDLIGALIREVREETGCEIEIGRLAGITLNVAVPRLTIFTFRSRHRAGIAYPGDDSIDAGWFAADAAVELVTHPVERLRLKDALEDDQGVVYRTYRRVTREDGRELFEMLHVHRA